MYYICKVKKGLATLTTNSKTSNQSRQTTQTNAYTKQTNKQMKGANKQTRTAKKQKRTSLIIIVSRPGHLCLYIGVQDVCIISGGIGMCVSDNFKNVPN